MSIVRWPGLIDPHVHLRDPGATQKEDFTTGSAAALAGGVTFMIDMPNNVAPCVTIARLEEKIRLADEKARCDIGFHYGTDGRNTDTFAEAAANPRVFGLKIYLNHTTGEMLIEDIAVLEAIFAAWPADLGKPILVHAEGVQLAAAIALAHLAGQRLHVCHISQAVEVELVRKAKAAGQSITAGVCPHHLFLTGAARETHGSHAVMKPPLGEEDDHAGLWQGLGDGTIDVVETDHAPHTAEEKQADPPPFGVPGLETSLGLMLAAVHDGKLELGDVKRLMHETPARIFTVPEQPETYIEFDPEVAYEIQPPFQSKAQWSPFIGMTAYGKVSKVVLRGETVVGE